MAINEVTASSRLFRIAMVATTHPVTHFVGLLGLCAAYLQGGADKLLDFPGAVAENQHFGLQPAMPIAAATIATELTGSLLILSGWYRWLGALWLGVFTLIATFVANRFWELSLPDRFMVENSFFEHLGLVGGFLLVAFYDLKQREPGSAVRDAKGTPR